MSTARFTEVFKTFYPKMGLDAVYKKYPLLEMVEHDDQCAPTGQVPVVIANSQKAGSDFAMVNTGSAGDFQSARFQWSQYPLYGNTDFEGASLRNFLNGGTSETAFKNYAIGKLNILLNSVLGVAARAMYSNGKNLFGRVGTGTASPVRMASRAQTAFIAPGMTLKFAAAADGTTPRAGEAVVTKVNSSTGDVTYTGTITSLAVGDYVFELQSFYTGSPAGLEGWNPETPSASFLTVDQTVASLQLSGYQYDCASNGTSIDTGIAAAINEHSALNGNRQIDFAMINPFDLDKLSRTMVGKLRYTTVDARAKQAAKAQIAFDAAECNGVPLIKDSTCPQGIVRGATYGNIHWGTNVAIPSTKMLDNLDWGRPITTATSDVWRAQSMADHAIWVTNPCDLLRIALPTS